MNELTGAFLIAREKKEDLRTTFQSLVNAGYNHQEIEEASKEANQLFQQEIINMEQPLKPKKKTKKWVLYSIILIAIFVIGISAFLFWDNLTSIFGGS